MTYENILVTRTGLTAHIQINRPPMNVINIPTIHEMVSALTKLDADPDVAFILFTGAGEKGFSTGVDIKDHTLDKVESMLTSFHQIFRTMAKTEKITIASVHGYCLGGGMELASACDFIIASDSAVFGQPEIKVGCYPPVAAALLPSIVGAKKAFEITMLGETFTAEEALRIGLISRSVPASNLQKETDVLLDKLGGMSASVLKLTKRALMAGIQRSYPQALDEAERIYLEELIKTKDIGEGISAFMEKRKPRWSNA